MGTDIHFAFQARDNIKSNWKIIEFNNNYKLYHNNIFDGRNYKLFEWLEDLAISLLQDKCPQLLENINLYYDKKYDFYDWDTTNKDELFGFGYATLHQFKEATKEYKNKLLNGTWVSEDFVDKFLASGGKFPKEFSYLNDDFKIIYEDDKYLLDILDDLINKFTNIAKHFDLNDTNLQICWHFDC